jgi:hypothetical protein
MHKGVRCLLGAGLGMVTSPLRSLRGVRVCAPGVRRLPEREDSPAKTRQREGTGVLKPWSLVGLCGVVVYA